MGFHHRTCWHEGCNETVYGPGILCHEHRARQKPAEGAKTWIVTVDHPVIERVESERSKGETS